MIVITLARKPFKGTIVDNILAYGTGGLNINKCRLDPTGERLGGGDGSYSQGNKTSGWTRPWMFDKEYVEQRASKIQDRIEFASLSGRWPSNVILSEGSAVQEMDRQSGIVPSDYLDDDIPQGASRYFKQVKGS